MSGSTTEEKRKETKQIKTLFLRSVIPRSQIVTLEGIRLVRASGESRDLVFPPSRSNVGLVSSRLAGFVRNRQIYNLGMVSRPVLFKIKGRVGFSYFRGSTNKQNENKMKQIDKIGQTLVSGALDDTKKMRKPGADIVAKSGPEQP